MGFSINGDNYMVSASDRPKSIHSRPAQCHAEMHPPSRRWLVSSPAFIMAKVPTVPRYGRGWCDEGGGEGELDYHASAVSRCSHC